MRFDKNPIKLKLMILYLQGVRNGKNEYTMRVDKREVSSKMVLIKC